jgi:hypothetical protein
MLRHGGLSMTARYFVNLLERVSEVNDFTSGDSFVKVLRQIYEVENVAYLCNYLTKPTHGNYYVHHSYSPAWADYYQTHNGFEIDPVVQAGFTNIIPVDWQKIPGLTSPQRNFLNAAYDFGIGKQGITCSVRGLHRETAIFSINTNHSDRDWKKYKREYIRDIQLLATYFHNKIAESQGMDLSLHAKMLTPREIECLKWCAAGKISADIAAIAASSIPTHHSPCSNGVWRC